MSTYDVFLSHSAKDREFVTRLATDLKRAGLNVWLDQWNIRPGDSFAQAINGALQATRFLLVVMSPDYFESTWASQEWKFALAKEIEEREIRVIPLLFRDCDVPMPLKDKLWVDFRDPSFYDEALNRLVRDLHALIAPDLSKRYSPETPRSGERVEDLSPNSLSELKMMLQDAMDAFRQQPTISVAPQEALSITETEEDLCFIVMPFSVESLNIVYEDFVRPTLEDRCKLRSERGDDVFGSNVVMDDITNSIRRARLIIADLTGRNPNVFYEVGIAHALNKQVLLMTQSIDDVPFDLRHRRALVYEYSPRGCKKLEKDLFENVQSILGHRDKV